LTARPAWPLAPLGAPAAAITEDALPPLDAVLAAALQSARDLAALHRQGVLQHPATADVPAAHRAPEQTGRTGRGVDQRTDLYALGAALYQQAAGRPPFEAQDPLRLVHEQLTRPPTPPSALRPGLPALLCAIVMRLLEKEPDRRYQSADGLVHDLARLQGALAAGDASPWPLGEHDFPQRLAAPARLIGRAQDMAALEQALDQAAQGRSRLVLVTGAAGVGKSALLNEVRALAAARNGRFVAGRFDQYRRDAQTAIAQALRALARLLLAEPEAELARGRERILQALGPNAGLATRLPEYGLLLGAQPEVAAADPGQHEARALQATLDLLRAVASAERPLVMALEDLQWARGLWTRFFEAVLAARDLPGLLVVASYRDTEVAPGGPLAKALPRWHAQPNQPLRLALDNLAPAGLAELLAPMLRLAAPAAHALAQAVAAHTGGNAGDSIELVNALRRDGLLTPGAGGWTWDAAALQRHVGQCSVVDLLAARIARLPADAQALLQALACLGGEASPALMQAATGRPDASWHQALAAAQEDGLLQCEPGADGAWRLSHNRVQQALHGALAPAQRSALHLALARRLAALPAFAGAAAEQYLAAADLIDDGAECLRAARLLRSAAAQARSIASDAAAERLLATARVLVARGCAASASASASASGWATGSASGSAEAAPGAATPPDLAALREALDIEHHATLCALGRLDEADAAYHTIEAATGDALALVDAACAQVGSLGNRGRRHEAWQLGAALLRRLGLAVPEPLDAGALARRSEALCRWVQQHDAEREQARPETRDARVIAIARLLNRLQAPAFFTDLNRVAWLVLESLDLWQRHGPCAALVANLSRATLVGVALRQDYRSGYQVVRQVLALSQARGYEPETSQARHLFAISTVHWFEPLEHALGQAERARAGMLAGGDLQNACFSYRASIPAALDCGPTLARYADEIAAGFGLATRTGNGHAITVNLADRQLLRALRGETARPGSFDDAGFDEQRYLAEAASNPMALASYHLRRALGCALFGEAGGLARHAAAAQPLLRYIESFYPTAWGHLLMGLALAQQLRDADGGPGDAAAQATCGAALDAEIAWLAQRAADAPVNFLHLHRLLQAERADAAGDFRQASRCFDEALAAAEARPRPWQHALIAERAGLFQLRHGLQHGGRALLAQALALYAAWGASAKVSALAQAHGLLPSAVAEAVAPATADEGLDALALLRASQALSSETSLAGLIARVTEVLGSLTGATAVRFAICDAELGGWFLHDAAAGGAAPIPVEQAAQRGLLPMSALLYAERTGEPLLVDDATRDDRFARDPALATLGHCSLLVVPVLSQGTPRALLLLENRERRGAFSAARLDAVVLIAGQLAVSLENARLYDRLEKRVQAQTQALRDAQAELMASARRAGMAEIASGVLHNVGNVLNSVNVSAGLIQERLRESPLQGLAPAVALLQVHAADLGAFLTQDPRGRLLPGYLHELAGVLAAEHGALTAELDTLARSVDHIKQVVATQQSYAGAPRLIESLPLEVLIDDALRMNADSLARHGIPVVKDVSALPPLPLDRHRLLMILVNLISNAKHAMRAAGGGAARGGAPCLRISAALAEGGPADAARRLRISVADNGEGIAPEHLTKVFSHGFTTRRDGHGFGLHTCALAAREMGGSLAAHSAGRGQGATFTLELPIGPATKNDGTAEPPRHGP
jgi:signal transduction histidine kinase